MNDFCLKEGHGLRAAAAYPPTPRFSWVHPRNRPPPPIAVVVTLSPYQGSYVKDIVILDQLCVKVITYCPPYTKCSGGVRAIFGMTLKWKRANKTETTNERK